MKTIAIIGCTGSIGTTSLNIIKKYKADFRILLLYANNNYRKLNQQIKIFNPKYVYLHNTSFQNKIKSKSKILYSMNKFLNVKKKIDYVISASSGYDALDLNFKLLKITRNLLIANKETIICGGKIFLKKAKKFNCNIIPIDSEHYCINFFLKNFQNKKKIKNYFLTGSGGPFFKKKPCNNISIKKVLNHPNWNMGKKISVNSANLTNKIMELFEANILFDIPAEKLHIKIERSSKIHSIISLSNGLDILIAHKTTMEVPIENSLIENTNKIFKKNLVFLKEINFNLKNPSIKNFPIIKTGYKVLKLGHSGMIIFTVLNDRLVEMFLRKEKKFNDIVNILIKIFKNFEIVNYSKRDIRNLAGIKKTITYANSINL